MSEFCYNNFYLVETLAGLIPITAILVHCFNSAKKAEKKHQAIEAAIEYSHRLEADELNGAINKKKFNAFMEKMKRANEIKKGR